MKNMIIILFFIFAFFLLFSFFGFYAAIHPAKIVSTITPKDLNVSFESVSFRTRDHLLLKGWFIPSENPKAKTIILLHGYPADKGDILPSRIFLHKKYNLLFFDFRYLGESQGNMTTAGKYEVLDLLAAIQYLQTRGINEVGVWGLSLGGAVALMTAPHTSAIKALVAESSYARLDLMSYEYYHIPILRFILGELTRFWAWVFLHFDIKTVSPMDAVIQIKIPILLIHSKADQVIPFSQALLLQEKLKHHPHVQMIIVEKNIHGETIDNYQEVIESFFAENLK